MNRIEMERIVGELLAERARLRRLNLELPPNKLMLLKRLAYRLGWNRGIQMKRKTIKYARPHISFSEVNPSHWHYPQHRSGLSVSARLLQKMVSVHNNDDVRALAASALKGESMALRALQDKLEEIGDPHQDMNWADAADFIDNADRGRNYFWGRPADVDNLIRGIPGRRADDEHKIGAAIEKAMRRHKRTGSITRVAHNLSQIASTLAKHPDYSGIANAIQSHLRSGMHSIFPIRMSGEVSGGYQTGNGHNIIMRDASHSDGTPLTWVSISYRNPKNPPGSFKGNKVNWRYQFAVPKSPEPTQMKRKVLPKKYAKIDSHQPAHHLIAGFPIEFALRHLANDPKNTDAVRALSAAALKDGDSKALWMLHDALLETDHPLAHGKPAGYNWMSAADKIHLDKHVHTALSEEGIRHRAHHGRGPNDPSERLDTAEGWASELEPHVSPRTDPHMPHIRRENTPIISRVVNRTRQLSKDQSTPDKDIHESIRRHAYRAQHMNLTEIMPDYAELVAKRAISPVPKRQGIKRGEPGYHVGKRGLLGQKATRYARLSLSPPKGVTGPSGEAMAEHSYHDEAGNKLGVVRIHPRNEGKHLYVHWIGPENGKAGEGMNQLGPEAIRSLKGGLKKHYPQAQFISGRRISGFRTKEEKKEPELTVKEFKRLPKKVIRFGKKEGLSAHSFYTFSNGTVTIYRHIPYRMHDGWIWKMDPESTATNHRSLSEAMKEYGNDLRDFIKMGTQVGGPVARLTPEEVWAHTDGKEGEAPKPPEQDWRPNEAIPEDFYSASRKGPKKKYAMSFRGDFLEALRRIRSSNQQALHMTAKRLAKQMGMDPTKTLNALHDTANGSTPGIAQAIYGNAAPEHVHAIGAWLGLTSNTPGFAVFHPRPLGPDRLYRFRQDGSGMDIRSKLDRVGIKERVMIPHRKGFDLIVPDKGGRMQSLVETYTKQNKIHYEMSPGFFHTLGSNDQAQARKLFRNTVVKSEKMSRNNRTPQLPPSWWMDPDGELYLLGNKMHRSWVEEHRDHPHLKGVRGLEDAFDRGWVRVLSYGATLLADNAKRNSISKKQMNALRDHAISTKSDTLRVFTKDFPDGKEVRL